MLKGLKKLGGVMLLAATAQGVAAESSYSVGVEYSSGDYDSGDTTHAWYIPVGWQYYNGRMMAEVTLPWLIVEGSSDVTYDGRRLSGSGMGSGGGGGTSASSRTASGMGDIIVGAGYLLLPQGASRPQLAARAKVKFGTASVRKGLGTGENDYSLQLDVAQGMFEGLVGYRWLGDTSTVDYNDIAFAGAALTWPLGADYGVRLGYYAEQASLSGSDDVNELTAAFNGRFENRFAYSVYYTAGFTDSSADSVIGASISSNFQ